MICVLCALWSMTSAVFLVRAFVRLDPTCHQADPARSSLVVPGMSKYFGTWASTAQPGAIACRA
jgi:hypothetical protein